MNFLFIIYLKKIKSTFIINDRSFNDVVVDPYRYRIGKFHKFLNFIYGIFLFKHVFNLLNRN